MMTSCRRSEDEDCGGKHEIAVLIKMAKYVIWVNVGVIGFFIVCDGSERKDEQVQWVEDGEGEDTCEERDDIEHDTCYMTSGQPVCSPVRSSLTHNGRLSATAVPPASLWKSKDITNEQQIPCIFSHYCYC